jgi:hypothetical protein
MEDSNIIGGAVNNIVGGAVNNIVGGAVNNIVGGTVNNNLEIHETLCCICYNDKLTLFLNCNHIVCLECITNIKKLCCPLCRAELSYLPTKIINIINNNSNSTLMSNNTSSYLSLLHNVVPLSLSSPNNLRYSLPQPSTFSPLPPLSTNFSPLPPSSTNLSLVNNDLLLYEQYFNDLAFIDIDDILHYGFINENQEGGGSRDEEGDGDGGGDGDSEGDGGGSRSSDGDSDSS